MNETRCIMIVGVGGQGTLLASRILGNLLTGAGYDVKVSEIHGMSQRGGSVTTQIRYGEKVYAPNIGVGDADLIISFEKIEAVRALPYLKKGGKMITDNREIYPMSVLTGEAEYPHNALDELKAAVGDLLVIPAAETAEKLGNIKATNIVLLGVLVKYLDLEDVDWESLIRQYVPAKAVDMNINAYRAGRAMAEG